MQENNFEKNVQQKLDALQLTPSGPVWQKIEAAIKKRRERRLVFWLLPALLVTGGLVWWQLAPQPSKSSPQQATRKIIPQSQQTFSKPHIEQTKPRNETGVIKRHKDLVAKNLITNETTIRANKKAAVHYAATTNQQTVTINQETKRNKTIVQEHSKNEIDKGNFAASNTPLNAKQSIAAPKYHPAQDGSTEKDSAAISNSDTLTKTTPAKTDSIQKVFQQPVKNSTKKKGLQWSVVGRIGVSNTVEPLLNGFGAKAFRTSYSSADYSGIPSNQDSVGYRQPSMPTRGLHFSVGAVIKKPVGKRSFLIAGLQYSFYSNHLAIGTELPVDSVIQAPIPQTANSFALDARKIFRNASSGTGTYNQFTNVYHFIELPIGFEYQPLKKFPLHIQHGFTLSRLLASKALEYDYASNAYYQRAAGLRKMSLGFFTTLEYALWKGKTFSLQAGPHLQYGLQSIFKNTSGYHLLSGGVSINMGF